MGPAPRIPSSPGRAGEMFQMIASTAGIPVRIESQWRDLI